MPEMKFTKTQLRLLRNKHPGCGYIVIHEGNDLITYAPICLGRNNLWSAGNRRLEEYLNDVVREVNNIGEK